LHSNQDIKADIEIEVAEVNVSAHLKILVQKGKRRASANVRRPIPAL
jgi:hypothetical protein